MSQQSAVERKALFLGGFAYLAMGIFGWYTFYLSNSEAMLLDGNYNIVNALASFAGYYIISIRSKRTSTFPWGQFVYESLYALVKGLLILGILTAALLENSLKIFRYFYHGETHQVNTSPIIPLVVFSTTVCFLLSRYYSRSNSKIGNISSMLSADTKAAKIDGYLSLFGGGSLVAMLFVGRLFAGLEFLQYIGDALVVIILELAMIKEPLHIIRENFLELAGGKLEQDLEWGHIYNSVRSVSASSFKIDDIFVTKTGSMFLVLVYISQNGSIIDVGEIGDFREKCLQNLTNNYFHCTLEIVLND
ncbi:MAG: cation transporter [Sphingobacterium sp.]|jgi:divalent metal cation (Fe/Co/Zn/Cd) transporter|nr:cation transporter [Sphingobacterium sp.]